MIHRFRRSLGIISMVAIVALNSGCSESARPVATGKGSVRGIAAIAEAPDGFFLIEERQVGGALYKGVAGFSVFDDLSYNFNFDLLVPNEENTLTRVSTQFIDVVADMEYTVVLTGSFDNPVNILWEDAEREWADTDTNFEPTFAHLSPAIGDVDIYFDVAGTTPILGNEIGSLTFGERVNGTDYPEGAYEITITAAGVPSMILYTSGEISVAPRTRQMFAIFDADPSITAPVTVNRITEGGVSSPLHDPTYPPQFRFYHVAFGTGNVDVYLDGDFSSPVFPNVGYNELSSFVDLPQATTLTITAVGNPGAVILENTIVGAPGNRLTVPMIGDPATLTLTGVQNNQRPLVTNPMLRFAHYSVGVGENLGFVNLYMLDPGTEITPDLIPQLAALGPFGDTGFFGLENGPIELTVTEFASLDPIAPPVTLDITAGDILDIALLNTVDPDMYEVSVYDRTP